MAHALHIDVAHSAFGDFVRRVVDVARDELKRRRIYTQTMRELSSLSDRELADLGLTRSMIRSLAIEAAYRP
ncbi:DUF1127 domain-containing protein [Actibacterium sp.]|uniref:DUF1127 domain-containing protein n=1 Tax=Actibacterium sp. TaxID=1872125 RepID=UPI0035627662